MPDMIRFVSNYDDLSTDKGFQFKFYCDKCRNGTMSRFQPNVMGTAAGLLNAAGSIFGGMLYNAGRGAYEIQRAVGGKAHDEALSKAVEEGKQYFHQCTRCGKWVCPEVCWNAKVGMCEDCAPDDQEELAAQQAQALSQQIYTRTRETDYTQGIDFKERQGIIKCSQCGAQMGSGKKFCEECGTPNPIGAAAQKHCAECGTKLAPGAKFCPDCGTKTA
jgi:uncharacterized OB-fold protein